MAATYPVLGDIWPYKEAAAPPELAALPVDFFFAAPETRPIQSAEWTIDCDTEAAPRASYALRVRQTGRQGSLARWDPLRGVWVITRRFEAPRERDACAIIELKGIVLGGVQNAESLETRLKNLLAAELSEAKAIRLLAKVLSVASVIVLFYAVRSGVESAAIEPFALIFALAVGIGFLAVGLRTRTKALGEQGLQRIREQFQFEYRKAEHGTLTLTTVTGILADNERKREEEAVIFGFLLLLCFVYFISPLVVIGVIVALVIVTMITGDQTVLRMMGAAFDRAETRLEQSALSFRASNDAYAPPALRSAKKEVLRDRMRRHADMASRVKETQARYRLTQDIAIAVAFFVIFSSYAFPIAAGLQRLAVSNADSLVSTSLFRVAPVIILLSISKSTVSLAQVLNRRLAKLAK